MNDTLQLLVRTLCVVPLPRQVKDADAQPAKESFRTLPDAVYFGSLFYKRDKYTFWGNQKEGEKQHTHIVIKEDQEQIN